MDGDELAITITMISDEVTTGKYEVIDDEPWHDITDGQREHDVFPP